MVFEKVKKILAQHKGIDEGSISMDSTFESLGLDSLDTVELLMQFEDEFGVTLQADQALRTVGDFVGLIEGSIK